MNSTTTSLRHALALAAPFLMGAMMLPIGCSAGTGTDGDDENIDTLGVSYEEFKASVFQEKDTGVWIVNGDTPIATERELKDFYLQNIQSGALAVATAGGVDSVWDATKKLNLTYCVSKSGFGDNYDTMVKAMDDATAAWEAAANINFVHSVEQDTSCTAGNSKVVFDVRQVSGQPYLARAFFPDQGRSSRNILVDTSSFGDIGDITLEGVLRHELGHTLGFRHEHTRSEAGTCYEDGNFRPLTPYDSKSVMHYPQCNGTNQGDLVLTDTDMKGAADLYGAAGGGTPQPPQPEPGTTCAHSICAAGGKLTANCDPCATKVCAADSYCCNNSWDATCVQEVESVCGQSCQSQPPPSCAHDTCVAGGKLSASCDSCATKVCAADSYCCKTAWDGVCVQQVESLCGKSCAAQ
jgi:hypothetical protein